MPPAVCSSTNSSVHCHTFPTRSITPKALAPLGCASTASGPRIVRDLSGIGTAIEVGNHLLHAGDTSGHAANHVVLIAVIDTKVRVGRPDQDSIDSAVPLFEIVEVTLNGVLARDGIVKYRSCTII